MIDSKIIFIQFMTRLHDGRGMGHRVTSVGERWESVATVALVW